MVPYRSYRFYQPDPRTDWAMRRRDEEIGRFAKSVSCASHGVRDACRSVVVRVKRNARPRLAAAHRS